MHALTKYQQSSTSEVVPECCTKRCSPKFWPGDGFCELRFRDLSPGSGGEKRWPLDHVWPYVIIHNWYQFLYICVKVFYLLPPCGTSKYVLVRGIFHNWAFANSPLRNYATCIFVVVVGGYGSVTQWRQSSFLWQDKTTRQDNNFIIVLQGIQ